MSFRTSPNLSAPFSTKGLEGSGSQRTKPNNLFLRHLNLCNHFSASSSCKKFQWGYLQFSSTFYCTLLFGLHHASELSKKLKLKLKRGTGKRKKTFNFLVCNFLLRIRKSWLTVVVRIFLERIKNEK